MRIIYLFDNKTINHQFSELRVWKKCCLTAVLIATVFLNDLLWKLAISYATIMNLVSFQAKGASSFLKDVFKIDRYIPSLLYRVVWRRFVAVRKRDSKKFVACISVRNSARRFRKSFAADFVPFDRPVLSSRLPGRTFFGETNARTEFPFPFPFPIPLPLSRDSGE